MLYRDSNMSTIIFYATVESEILHLARTNSCKEKFYIFITTLLLRMHRHPCQNMQLKCLLNKLFGKHSETYNC